ncbi:hypothetical protein CEK29_11765 [Bordetella genomosp. 5]|nr:hypothetical protein CEK29_11765 [Bordetella genomosp. 5]
MAEAARIVIGAGRGAEAARIVVGAGGGRALARWYDSALARIAPGVAGSIVPRAGVARRAPPRPAAQCDSIMAK